MDWLLQAYHSHTTKAVFEALVASGLISVLLQTLKQKLSLLSDKLLVFLLTSLSFIGVGINYLLGAASQDPTILGQQTIVVVGLSTLIYRLLIKDASSVIKDAKTLRDQREAGKVVEPAQHQTLAPVNAEQPSGSGVVTL